MDPARDTAATARSLTVALSAPVTDAVLSRVPAAFNASVDDVLLTALTVAVAARHGAAPVLVDLEGHGRHDVVAGLDLARTMGWFTSVHPVRLDPGPVDWDGLWAAGPAAGRLLKRVKEQLRAVPDHGLGHGLLRYLNPDTAPELAALPAPQIGFNYLGRFDTAAPDTDWGPAPETVRDETARARHGRPTAPGRPAGHGRPPYRKAPPGCRWTAPCRCATYWRSTRSPGPAPRAPS
ncbi:condensation domain-containing protein [Streptomyces sp. M19]